MRLSKLPLALTLAVPALTLGFLAPSIAQEPEEEKERTKVEGLAVQYLEIVTPDVEETIEALESIHDVEFSKPIPELGGARMATLESGGEIGVRAPMHEQEEPVVRPYLLVEDIGAAVKAAEDAGAKFAIGATEIPDRGTFALYFHGENQYGLWER
ncbi:MAG: hydroxylase [Planctomycetota bacterium]